MTLQNNVLVDKLLHVARPPSARLGRNSLFLLTILGLAVLFIPAIHTHSSGGLQLIVHQPGTTGASALAIPASAYHVAHYRIPRTATSSFHGSQSDTVLRIPASLYHAVDYRIPRTA